MAMAKALLSACGAQLAQMACNLQPPPTHHPSTLSTHQPSHPSIPHPHPPQNTAPPPQGPCYDYCYYYYYYCHCIAIAIKPTEGQP